MRLAENTSVLLRDDEVKIKSIYNGTRECQIFDSLADDLCCELLVTVI